MNRFIEIRGLSTATFREHDLPLSIGGEHGDLTVPGIDDIVAYIGESEGFLFLQPIVPGLPVFVNDELIDASVWLKSGDICRVGKTAFYLTLRGNRTIIELVTVDEKPLAPSTAPPPKPTPYRLNCSRPGSNPLPSNKRRAIDFSWRSLPSLPCSPRQPCSWWPGSNSPCGSSRRPSIYQFRGFPRLSELPNIFSRYRESISSAPARRVTGSLVKRSPCPVISRSLFISAWQKNRQSSPSTHRLREQRYFLMKTRSAPPT